MRKVLGILILVLFLGTAFAGLAQGYGEHENGIKSGNGAMNEIKSYIIVKRYTENKTINKWIGDAQRMISTGLT